jgi:hypothetical protein
MNVSCSFALIRTVFVITDQVPSLRSIMAPFSCVVAILALLLLALLKLRRRRLRLTAAIVLPIVLIICWYWTLFGVLHWFTYSVDADKFSSAFQQYQNGDYQTAEGVVSGCQYTHEKGFCFSAGSTQVCTGPHFTRVGYHRNGTSPFILEDGMKVRVYYRDGTILRIDLIE